MKSLRLPGPWARVVALILSLAFATWTHAAIGAPHPSPLPSPSSAAPAAAESEEEEPEAPDSPRASLEKYLALTTSRNFEGAARYLQLPRDEETRGPELARKLRSVLDRYDWIDLDTVSPKATGNLDDDLPANFEQIGTVPGPGGGPEPVRLVRKAGKESLWLFSRATVQRVDDWYARLPDRYLLETLPPALLGVGPRSLLYWQWIALPILLLLCGGVGVAASFLTRHGLSHVVKRTPTPAILLRKLAGPMTLALSLLAAHLVVPFLALYAPAERFVDRLLRGILFFDFFWALARLVDVGARMIVGSPWTKGRHASRAVLSLVGRVGNIVVATIAVVAFLSELGYHVESLIAGLGLGGLAVALAAQKTVENLFGAFSIGADQPFREGDFVKVDDLIGTVEFIGLRSTKIRTLERSLVSVPNGKLAEMRLESLSARDRIRFFCVLRLVHETTVDQVTRILSDCERLLAQHPLIGPEGPTVRFAEIGDFSLNVEVGCWFKTTDFREFLVVRQNVLLEFLRIVARAGTTFMRPPAPRPVSFGKAVDAALSPSNLDDLGSEATEVRRKA